MSSWMSWRTLAVLAYVSLVTIGLTRILVRANFTERFFDFSFSESRPLGPDYTGQTIELHTEATTAPSKATGNATEAATWTYRNDLGRAGNSEERIKLPLAVEWTTDALNVGIHTASKGSPAVDETGVYVGSDAGWLRAYSHGGTLNWKFFAASANWGIHGTPVVTYAGVIIGAYNGRLYRLKKKDGSLLWVTRLGDAIGSAPLIVNGELYVTSETALSKLGTLSRLSPSSGQVVWSIPWIKEQIHSSPAWDETRSSILFGANDGFLRSVHALSGELRWKFPTGGAIKGTPAISGERAYVTSWDGFLYSIRLTDGAQVWRVRLTPNASTGASQSSPVIFTNERRLIVLTSDREDDAKNGSRIGHVLGVDLDSGQIVWRLSSKTESPAIGSATGARTPGGIAIAITPCPSRSLCVIRAKDGVKLQEIELPSRLSGAPTIYEGSVYLALDGEGGLMKLTSKRQ